MRKSETPDDATIEKIAAHIANGMPLKNAAAQCGVTFAQARKWKSRARQEDCTSRQLKKFLEAVEQAESEHIRRSLDTINRCAEGGEIYKQVTITKPDGSEQTIEERTRPDWRAASWAMERRYPSLFGKRDHHKIESTHRSENINVDVEITANLTEAEQMQLTRLLKKAKETQVIETQALPAAD